MPSTVTVRAYGPLVRASRGDLSAREKFDRKVRERVAEDPERAVLEAQKVYRRARQEKTLAEQHRRRAKALMHTFDEFRRNLEARGIRVVIENPVTHATKEGTSDPDATEGR